DPPRPPIEQPGPPRRPLPDEDEIDISRLEFGDLYPGRYDGHEYSTDSQGNVLDLDGRIARNPPGAPDRVEQLRGRPGRLKVAPKRRLVLVRRQPGDDDWETVFAGVLTEPFDFGTSGTSDRAVDVSRLSAGDVYGGPLEPAQELRFKQ